jgi:ubiquinone/menaquinone biosynthesis C-methylase UbiE
MSQVKTGTDEYERHKQAEIEHYKEIFAGEPLPGEPLFQPVPPVWKEIEGRAAKLVRDTAGHDCLEYLGSLLKRPGRENRMLSLGSGPGGIELSLAEVIPGSNIVCVDFNSALLDLGAKQAKEHSLAVTFEQGDLNTIELPKAAFDIVFCHASLHHVIELEHLMAQIRGALRPGGQLVVLDVITRSGYLMWPETKPIVEAIFRTLPPGLRLNHTAYPHRKVDETVWEADTSQSGMECIRSEDILPLLRKTFSEKYYAPYFSLSRRFFDTMYGPNYRMSSPLHMAIVNWIWELDCHYIAAGELKPETFFGVYLAG